MLTSSLLTLAALAIAMTTAAVVGSIASLFIVTHRRRRRLPAQGASAEPVTVLKPLCGADDALEGNLRTFFEQTHPNFELVFGVMTPEDAALPIVDRLRAEYPGVRARVVIGDGRPRALNLKVANLRRMLEAGSHDLVLISDSNVAAEPDYVLKMVGQMSAGERVGLVTNLFAGTGEETLGARLDNLHLNGVVAGSVAATQVLTNKTAAIGKSMLFRLSLMEALGGFESVATLLAEDWVIGRMFSEAGYEVRLCEGVIENVNASASVRGFLSRQTRWSLIRSRLTPLGYLFEPLANPMVVGVATSLMLWTAWPLLMGVGLTLARDALSWIRLRGTRGLAKALPLSPLKELLVFGCWAAALFKKTVSWRGQSYRVGAGTRLFAKR